jgi:hypothetical protein
MRKENYNDSEKHLFFSFQVVSINACCTCSSLSLYRSSDVSFTIKYTRKVRRKEMKEEKII